MRYISSPLLVRNCTPPPTAVQLKIRHVRATMEIHADREQLRELLEREFASALDGWKVAEQLSHAALHAQVTAQSTDHSRI